MTRKFKTVDYEAALEQTISLREALPASHLARCIVDVVAELDLAPIYERYGPSGGEAYAPEVLVALLFYGYATGVFSSRKTKINLLLGQFSTVICNRVVDSGRKAIARRGYPGGSSSEALPPNGPAISCRPP